MLETGTSEHRTSGFALTVAHGSALLPKSGALYGRLFDEKSASKGRRSCSWRLVNASQRRGMVDRIGSASWRRARLTEWIGCQAPCCQRGRAFIACRSTNYQGVHKHVDTDDHLTEGRVSPSAVNGSESRSPPPVLPKGGNSDSLGLNRPS